MASDVVDECFIYRKHGGHLQLPVDRYPGTPRGGPEAIADLCRQVGKNYSGSRPLIGHPSYWQDNEPTCSR